MASVQPKNSGGPITKFWEAPDTISALEHVKAWLCKHAKKVRTFFPRFFRQIVVGVGFVRHPFPGQYLVKFSSNLYHFLLLFQHVQSDPPTAKSLSQLISQMLQFQEDALGKSAKNPPFPRLPVSFIYKTS